MPRPLNLRGKSPGTHWIGGWVDPSAGLDNVKRKFLTLPGLELRLLGRPAEKDGKEKKRRERYKNNTR
jgi:hypothetical protein